MEWLQRLVHAILGRAPEKIRRSDTATRMGAAAYFDGARSSTSEGDRREPLRKGDGYIPPEEINPIKELQRIIGSDDDQKPEDVPPSILRRSAGPQPSASRRRRPPRRRP